MRELNEIRKQIDEIDRQLADLFKKRLDVAKEVAESKRGTGKKVYDREREEEKLTGLEKYARDDFEQQGIRELFLQIMSISRKLQYKILGDENKGEKPEVFVRKSVMEKKGKKVACYGVPGSHTEHAMEEFFGKEVERFHETSFRAVMERIASREADFGVLPIENSSTGSISDVYDLLKEYDHYIVGEHILKIEQSLVALPGTKLSDIKKVFSHTQGILQCREFLKEHPWMEAVEYKSTAESAEKVQKDKDKTQAAIAGARTAEMYDLEVLVKNANFADNNATRFIIVTNQKMYYEDADKVSICFEIPHEKGSLYNILSHIIFNNLNMTGIESRPLEGKSWEYRFFVDFEGNLSDPAVRNTLNGIQEEVSELKILGNFKAYQG